MKVHVQVSTKNKGTHKQSFGTRAAGVAWARAKEGELKVKLELHSMDADIGVDQYFNYQEMQK